MVRAGQCAGPRGELRAEFLDPAGIEDLAAPRANDIRCAGQRCGPRRRAEQYQCKDVMREPDQNRAVAIAFLHGYLLGKSNDSKFNVEALEKQTDSFIEQCLDNPQANAEGVMLKIKK